MRSMRYLIPLLLFPAAAQAQDLIGSQGSWDIYRHEIDGQPVCYLVTAPEKSSGNFKSRGEPYLMVARNGSDEYEISASSGYLYKPGSSAKLSTDGAKFTLTTSNNRAWLKEDKDDSAAVKAMKQGDEIILSGTSKRGTASQDSFSLDGFSAAMRQLDKLCQ